MLILVCYWPPDFLDLQTEGKTRRQQFAELDFIGILLFGGGLAVFLLGIGFGGNPHPWTSAIVLCPIILGGLCVFLAFPLWEVYSPDTIAKICPPYLFRNVKTVVIPCGVTFVSGMALISLGTLWPQQVSRLYTTVPATIGWYGLANQGCATGKTTLNDIDLEADPHSRVHCDWTNFRHSTPNKMAVHIRGDHDGAVSRTQRYS